MHSLVAAFDGNDLARGVRATGLYLKHRGNMAAARDFLCQSGASDLAYGYEAAARRLPVGWLPLYAGNYYGRNHGADRGHARSVVRLEVALEPALCEAFARDASGLCDELARLGFPDADDTTIGLSAACARLLSFGLPATTQLDVHEDGSLAPTFGLTLFFPGAHDARMTLFGPNGPANQALRCLEALGVADDRWLQAARNSFALPVPLMREDGTTHVIGATCQPDCVKLKWKNGRLAPARWYQLIRVASLGPLPRA